VWFSSVCYIALITVMLVSLILLEHLFNLRFAAKDLERNAKKSEKLEKEEKVKLKKVTCQF